MKIKEMPKKIKEGCSEYKIEQKHPLNDDKDLGQILFPERIIKVDPKQHPLSVKETLLHEIVHLWLLNLHVGGTLEEVLCDNLAEKMICTMRNNPKLRKYLFED